MACGFTDAPRNSGIRRTTRRFGVSEATVVAFEAFWQCQTSTGRRAESPRMATKTKFDLGWSAPNSQSFG